MKIREAILKLGTYRPPLEERNPQDYLLLDFNESPLPPSPQVQQALMDYIQTGRLQTYPAYGTFLEQLGEYAQVPPQQLILTNGSDQAIDIILRALLNEGDEMVIAQPGFAMFFQVAGTLGTKVISPQYEADLGFPFAAIVAAVTPQTRLLVVINPNNPTGTSVSQEQIEILLKTFPEIAILIDEAYFEFTQQTVVPLLHNYPNLIIIRTFSKAFAIPSLRLGYAIAQPDFIEQLYKIRGPYDVNMLALVAARSQLQHPTAWQAMVQEVMLEAKPLLEHFFEKQGVSFYKGDANFMLVAPDDVEGAMQFLKDHRILVRPMRPPIAHTFRVSVGTLPQIQHFIQVYSDYLNHSPHQAGAVDSNANPI